MAAGMHLLTYYLIVKMNRRRLSACVQPCDDLVSRMCAPCAFALKLQVAIQAHAGRLGHTKWAMITKFISRAAILNGLRLLTRKWRKQRKQHQSNQQMKLKQHKCTLWINTIDTFSYVITYPEEMQQINLQTASPTNLKICRTACTHHHQQQ